MEQSSPHYYQNGHDSSLRMGGHVKPQAYPQQFDPTSPNGSAPSAAGAHLMCMGTPTVRPVHPFDPVADIKSLNNSIAGCCFGADKSGLIQVLCHRSNEQLQEIHRDYRIRFDHDLVDEIQSATGGDLEDVLVSLLQPRPQYLAQQLHAALDRLVVDAESIVEILCALSNHEVLAVKAAYEKSYAKLLESTITGKTFGNFERLLIALCAGHREENPATIMDSRSSSVETLRALEDARQLFKAGVDRMGTDESVFIQLLTQRSWPHLVAVCEQYLGLTGHTLRKAIGREFSGDIKMGLTTIVNCATNKDEYFARRLHRSMVGLGTKDGQLIRLLVTRSSIDLADIRETFERLFGESLHSWIKGDTSGHYRDALYHLIGESH